MQYCSHVFFTISMVYRKAKSKALVKRDARWTLVFHDWNYNRFDTSMLGAKVTFLTMDSEQCCIILRMNGKIWFYFESCFVHAFNITIFSNNWNIFFILKALVVAARHYNLLRWLKHLWRNLRKWFLKHLLVCPIFVRTPSIAIWQTMLHHQQGNTSILY